MSELVIKTEGLTKKYKNNYANDHVSLTVNKGEIYGLVGRNGAGKTTFMKMLLGIIQKDAGTMEMMGHGEETIDVARAECGFIIENPKFYEKMTAHDNLVIFAKLRGIKKEQYEADIDEALEKVGLLDKKNDKVKSFSLGMRQSLGIASAILGNPQLLILDEPINGLDPIAIANIRDVFLEMNKNGTTIIISSHILAELEKLATCYGFIVEGKLVKEISEQEIKEEDLDLEKVFLETARGEA